jgi:hypothetical protein
VHGRTKGHQHPRSFFFFSIIVCAMATTICFAIPAFYSQVPSKLISEFTCLLPSSQAECLVEDARSHSHGLPAGPSGPMDAFLLVSLLHSFSPRCKSQGDLCNEFTSFMDLSYLSHGLLTWKHSPTEKNVTSPRLDA